MRTVWMRACALITLCMGFSCQAAWAQEDTAQSSKELAERLGVRLTTNGSSSRADRRDAIAALPLQSLNPQQRARADAVLQSISQFRRLPTVEAPIHPEVYQYFVAHPDVAVSLWRVMKISDFQMWQTGEQNFEADAGDGSEGVADFLYRDHQQSLAICEGIYQNPLLTKPIRARALVHLKYVFRPASDGGPPKVTQQISAFISFPSTTVKTVARVISPLTNRIMDRNALEVSVFLKVMSDSMQSRPNWVRGMASQLEGVLPVRRTELADLAGHVNTQARARNVEAYLRVRNETDTDVARRVLRISTQPPVADVGLSAEPPR